MSEVKRLPANELEECVRIFSDAYPGIGIVTADDRERVLQRFAKTYDDPTRCIFGHYRGHRLLGIMILYDLQTKLLTVMAPAGGVVRFQDLWTYGLADVSDEGYVEVVDRLFRID